MSFSRFNNGGSKSGFSRYNQPKTPQESLQKQIGNAEMRIQDAGFDVKDADQRNWFEKATNLQSGQNWFFDGLELLGRPGQAVLNAIDKGLTGGNALDAAVKGFTGEQKIRGADIVKKSGIDNGVAKFVLGTALDIATDPLTFVPGGVLAKGAKGIGKAASIPLKGAYNAAESVAPVLKKYREEVVQPGFSRFKERAGYMFSPDYKATETLDGGQSSVMLDAYRNTENSRRFMNEEYGKRLVDTAKGTGIESGELVGREMEHGLNQFDELGNPLPRTKRPKSFDPKITRAAQELMKTNSEIRDLAMKNGINIDEIQGYMTHILSKEERVRKKAQKGKKLDNKFLGTNQPNKSILNKRKLMGSVEDVNEKLGRQFFEPNAYFATAIGQKRLIDFIHSVSFRKQVLNNPDFARKYEPGIDVPPNAVVIDSNNYRFIKEADDVLEGISQDIGGKYVVTKAAKEKLDRYKYSMTDEGTKTFLRAVDKAQSFWKRAALFSTTYHIRNDVGAKFNEWIGGMSGADIVKYSTQGTQDVFNAMVKGKETPKFREYRQQGLSSGTQSGVELSRLGEDFEKTIERSVKEQSQDLKGKIKTRINPLRAFETSREVGDFVDQTNRFATYLWAREKLGLNPQEAAQKVKEIHFDYTNLTNFERDVMARIFPFYRWSRNNIPYQIKKFIEDPRKYEWANKVRMNAQEAAGINEENAPDYLKEQFALPVYSDGQGKGKMLGLNLPISDLTKLSSPGKTLVDSATPLLKLVPELTLNRNFYFNKPIEQFEGQERRFQIPGTDIEFGTPAKATYALEQATGQIGRGFTRFLEKEESVDQDLKFRVPTFGISSLFKDFDVDKANEYQLRRKLYELMDYMDVIEQRTGERPRTVNEIQKGN